MIVIMMLFGFSLLFDSLFQPINIEIRVSVNFWFIWFWVDYDINGSIEM